MTVKRIADSGAVVLGGTAGVGAECAARLAEAGAHVVIMGRDDARGAAACTALRDRVPGARVDFVRVDATRAEEATRAEAEARAILGSIDILICTTGPSEPPRLLHRIPIDTLRDRVEEVILPPMHMIHAVLPAMRAQGGGSIVTVASDAAKVATPGEALIGAAMAAIVMFCKSAAIEAKREGVRINLLTPSLIAGTPGAALIGGDPFASKMFEKAAGMAHLGVAEAADLAEMALFLAGPGARRITGQAISVNGGISVA